ncbi:hypothetical protein [Pyrodictium abyssi]|uniref:MotA/TolQ/ExbB proton channel domain-containing protein n=1 Tax=Pyrodictium abyssi TaxID=54256 RepID=A0ABM8ISK2_9CREN|nr:hypothetical protein PABY_01070 [Pyrodictium abyssi]
MLVSRLAALQGALAFTSLLALLAVATAPTGPLLARVAEFLVAASVVSALSTWMMARSFSEALSRALSKVSSVPVKQLGPRGATDAAIVAQSVAGLEQVASLWPVAAAGLGAAGIVTSILSYYMARRGCRALIRLAERLGAEPPCRSPPGLSVAAASSITLMGLGASALLVAPSYHRVAECIEATGAAIEEQLRTAQAESREQEGNGGRDDAAEVQP